MKNLMKSIGSALNEMAEEAAVQGAYNRKLVELNELMDEINEIRWTIGSALNEMAEEAAVQGAYNRKLVELSELMDEINEIRWTSSYNKVRIERKLKEMQEMIAQIV